MHPVWRTTRGRKSLAHLYKGNCPRKAAPEGHRLTHRISSAASTASSLDVAVEFARIEMIPLLQRYGAKL